MTSKATAPVKLHFDLKRPCAECPFRKGVPAHEGVFKSIPRYYREIQAGRFLHTCHRTDPRSDYLPAKGYKGKLQHCAGALAMQVNEGTAMRNALLVELAVFSRRRFLPDQLPKNPEVFGSFRELALYYFASFKHLLRPSQDQGVAQP
jgi:hypothetical protein